MAPRKPSTSRSRPPPNQGNNEALIAQLTAAMTGVMEQRAQEAREENQRQMREMFEQLRTEMLGPRGAEAEGDDNGGDGQVGEESSGQLLSPYFI